jgi:hypothetical protein
MNGFVEHLSNDILPRILETAFATATKFAYCKDCKGVVEYEKSPLESDGRTGLEIVCARCHSVICTFLDTKPPEESKPGKASSCLKCGMDLPCGIDGFDAVDALRCSHCDTLFERGQFVCYGAKPQAHQN